jgi:cell division transport system permease protein
MTRAQMIALVTGNTQADRVVPPTGPSAWLTLFTAGAMTFLAVFALALSLATGRLADRWSDALARTATIRISASDDQMEAQTLRVLDILQATPGIASARALTDEEEKALLAPWFGPDLPLDQLPIPKLIEITEADPGYDAEGLRQRLVAEAPAASLDDHTRWRRPLAEAAQKLRLLGLISIVLILCAMAAMITLATNASLEANAQIIKVMRLVGARDTYIARAFVRRFTLRTLIGAAIGCAAGMLGIVALPAADTAGGFLTGLGFQGAGWFLPLLLPPLAALIAFAATRRAAFAKLRTLT